MNAASPKPLINLFNRTIPAWSYPLFVQNIFMALHSGFGPDWMGQTWSLAVEEQFYLLLPLAIRGLGSKAVVRLTMGAVLFAPLLRTALWFVANTDKARYTLLPCRADALGIGVLIALACRDEEIWTWLVNHRRPLYAAFAVLGLGFCYLTWHYGGRLIGTVGYTWIAAFYGSLLLLVLVNPGRVERGLFSSRILVRLGTLAYAVYLFHEPINSLCHWAIFGSLPSIHNPATAVVTVLAFAASVVLAEVSWRLLERPLIRRAHAKYQYTTSAVRPAPAGAAASA